MDLTPLALAIAAAAGNLLGAMVVVRHARGGLRLIEATMAFGAGFMLAVVLVGVLPHVFRDGAAGTGLFVLGGYLAVHLAHHVLVPHFHFGEETHQVSATVGLTALLGLSIHSFFDGVAIAAGFLEASGLGILLFLAVLLHKLPEGVTMASVVMAGGRPGRQGILAAAVLGGATVLGVLLTDFTAALQRHGLAIAAGVTLYVAASNLVPEFQNKRRPVLTLAFFGGALALVLLESLSLLPG
ncbi:MAG TPA: ZIP family metal transporter [Gemmatimonadales bacterium]|nr:ZIP family metal transporter [Gemmatimonadales bacterium]